MRRLRLYGDFLLSTGLLVCLLISNGHPIIEILNPT